MEDGLDRHIQIVEVGNRSFNSFNDNSVNNLEPVKSETDLLEDVSVDHLSDDEGSNFPMSGDVGL